MSRRLSRSKIWHGLGGAALFTVQLLIASSAFASATTLCCVCKYGPGEGACLTTQKFPSCGNLSSVSKNPLVQNFVCFPISDAECKKSNPGDKGLCANDPVDSESFAGLKEPEGRNIAGAPHLGIPIPGLRFADNIRSQGGYYTVPWLRQYIAAVYRYLVGASVIAAAIMVTYGGFLYLVGGTISEGTIGKGRTIIQDAIVGLLFLLGAYGLLRTLNPNLVNIQGLKIKQITTVTRALETVNADMPPAPGEPNGDFMASLGVTTDDTASLIPKDNQDQPPPADTPEPPKPPADASVPPPTPTNTDCNPKDKVPYFAQGQAPWGNKPLGNKAVCTGNDIKTQGDESNASCCQAYGFSACGPTALAMVLKAYGEDVTPQTIGDIAVAGGLRNCNSGGVSPNGVIKTGRFPNYTVDYSLDSNYDPKKPIKEIGKKNIEALDTALKAGKPVIVLCQGCRVSNPKNKNNAGASYSFKGHFMLLTGLDADNNYTLNDPSRSNYQTISRKQITGPTTSLIYIRKTDDTPISICK